jgi:hypothetical protein
MVGAKGASNGNLFSGTARKHRRDKGHSQGQDPKAPVHLHNSCTSRNMGQPDRVKSDCPDRLVEPDDWISGPGPSCCLWPTRLIGCPWS